MNSKRTTPTDRFDSIAAEVRAELASITTLAHVNTFHPNAFDWAEPTSAREREFLSRIAFGEVGHEATAVAYITKELAQLAEIERHVSAVMALVLGELHDHPDALNAGYELHNAVSCFAAEEFQHSNTFYRYVRALSGVEPRVPDALFDERLDVFRGDEHPYVKLVALCCSAYVGESVITVFEHRADALDPQRREFFTRLLHTHGLDEARHVKIDHVAMTLIHPQLTDAERASVRTLLGRIEDLNRQLSQAFAATTTELLGVDPAADNPAASVQLQMTRRFGELMFAADGSLRTVDDILDSDLADLAEIIIGFSGSGWVHAAPGLGLGGALVEFPVAS